MVNLSYDKAAVRFAEIISIKRTRTTMVIPGVHLGPLAPLQLSCQWGIEGKHSEEGLVAHARTMSAIICYTKPFSVRFLDDSSTRRTHRLSK